MGDCDSGTTHKPQLLLFKRQSSQTTLVSIIFNLTKASESKAGFTRSCETTVAVTARAARDPSPLTGPRERRTQALPTWRPPDTEW